LAGQLALNIIQNLKANEFLPRSYLIMYAAAAQAVAIVCLLKKIGRKDCLGVKRLRAHELHNNGV
jgi:hypothetical protein